MYFTEKQLRIMEFIQQFRSESGISPTLEEIAKKFNVTKITIYEHVNQLERKGAIRREKFRARSIEILIPVEERGPRYTLPLMGNLRDGAPIEALNEREDLNLSQLLPLGKRCYALRVCGSSMESYHIADGDYVIVDRQGEASDGDTVVAVLDGGEATVKQFFMENDRIRLESANGQRSVLYPEAGQIRGVVLGVFRQLAQSVGADAAPKA